MKREKALDPIYAEVEDYPLSKSITKMKLR